MEDREAKGYLTGYKYEGGYRVWALRIGVKEVRDVTFYEGTVLVLPGNGSTAEVQRDRVQVVHLPNKTPGPTTPAPAHTHHRTQKMLARTTTGAQAVVPPAQTKRAEGLAVPARPTAQTNPRQCLLTRSLTPSMSSVLRLHNNDQRISYNNDWKIIPNSGVGQNESFTYTSTLGADLFFLFRG